MSDAWMPAPPEDGPPEQRGEAEVMLRYEDVRQTGMLSPSAAPFAVGELFWRRMLVGHPMERFAREQGILPILARAVVTQGEGPIDVTAPVSVRARYELQRAPGGTDDDAERLYLNLWGSIEAPVGRTNFPPPDDHGRRVTCARVFLEHVFTRPFAPREQRRITRFGHPSMPAVGELSRYVSRPEAELAAPPAEPLGPAWQDPAPFVFGFDHTDSNQHVNSLVHPRVFCEAAARRAWELGERRPLALSALEIAYKKPFFAGERAQVTLTPGRRGPAELEATGELRGDGEARPRCTLRVVLSVG